MNFNCQTKENVNLKNYNTYRVSAMCKMMVFPKNVAELQDVISNCLHLGIKFFVLGNGSNVILNGEYFDGVVINMLSLTGAEKVSADEIIAYSGTLMPKLVRFALDNNLQGLEWASGIPGTLGGGIYGNCGAYKECIFDYLEEIIVLHNGKIEHMKKEKVAYDYRTSFFKNKKQYVIVAARLKLKPGNKEAGQEIIADRLKRRMASQPLTYPSAGSVFRNPAVDIYAGKLIEDCNLKGYKIGGAEVSNKHANFIVNTGGATAKDIITIINYLKKTIKDKYDIDLILEQEIVNWE